MREERGKPKSQGNALCQTALLLETSCPRGNQSSWVAVTLLTRDTSVSLHIGLIRNKAPSASVAYRQYKSMQENATYCSFHTLIKNVVNVCYLYVI